MHIYQPFVFDNLYVCFLIIKCFQRNLLTYKLYFVCCQIALECLEAKYFDLLANKDTSATEEMDTKLLDECIREYSEWKVRFNSMNNFNKFACHLHNI